MLWKIFKGVVAAVVVKKIAQRYLDKDKQVSAPVQLDLDIPARPRRSRKPVVTASENPLNATESTI